MYLADVFRTIIDDLSPADKVALSKTIGQFKVGLSEAMLRCAEFFVFNKSALLIAGCLKIYHPAELRLFLTRNGMMVCRRPFWREPEPPPPVLLRVR